MGFNPKQQLAIHHIRNPEITEIVFGGGAGGGKSYLGCRYLLEGCMLYPNTRWVMGRRRLKYLKQTTLQTFFEVAKMLGVQNEYIYKEQKGEIHFPRFGSVIILKDMEYYPSDPDFDSLGSLEITGAFVDEISEIRYQAWIKLKSRIRYKLDEYGLAPCILGSCNPAKNWVYRLFYKPDKKRTIAPHRAFVQALVTDNPHISRHYISNLRTMPKASQERYLFGNWEYDDDPLKGMEYDNILHMFEERLWTPSDRIITCDPAGTGKDAMWLFVWNGLTIVDYLKEDKTDQDHLLKELETRRRFFNVKRKNVIVDKVGLGEGVTSIGKYRGYYDQMPCIKTKGTISDKSVAIYKNLGHQTGYKACELVNSLKPYVKCPMKEEDREWMIEELDTVKKIDPDKDMKERLMSKDDMAEILGRSPGAWDTFKIRMWDVVKPRVKGSSSERVIQREYDPLKQIQDEISQIQPDQIKDPRQF